MVAANALFNRSGLAALGDVIVLAGETTDGPAYPRNPLHKREEAGQVWREKSTAPTRPSCAARWGGSHRSAGCGSALWGRQRAGVQGAGGA